MLLENIQWHKCPHDPSYFALTSVIRVDERHRYLPTSFGSALTSSASWPTYTLPSSFSEARWAILSKSFKSTARRTVIAWWHLKIISLAHVQGIYVRDGAKGYSIKKPDCLINRRFTLAPQSIASLIQLSSLFGVHGFEVSGSSGRLDRLDKCRNVHDQGFDKICRPSSQVERASLT